MAAIRKRDCKTAPRRHELRFLYRFLGLSAALALVLGACPGGPAMAQSPGDAAPPAAAPDSAQTPDSQGFDTPYDSPASIQPSPESTDPPSRVARVSVLNGNVSAEPASVNTFSPAEVNQVLTTGDRLYTDSDATAELEAGGIAVRLGGGADLTVTAMTNTLAQFGLAAGSVHLRSYAIDPGTVLELDSPEAAVTVLQPGDARVDVDAAAHTTTISLTSGQVQVDGPSSSQILTQGQSVIIHGGNPDKGEPAYTESIAQASADKLDGFSETRDNLYASEADAVSPYLGADMVGGADLAESGTWDTSDFGPVWYPVVAVDWQPYCFGHWRWVAPWGWTWVGIEPWGFAPFHYGRWAHFGDGIGGRWGWIPGSRGVRPVYAPALVVFAGGARFSRSLGYAPGADLAAWFPLGPREPYAPPYHGSTLYVNRVNASNLYNPNQAEVRGFYNQRAVNVFTGTGSANRVYADRAAGTVAVPQNSFASGRSVKNAVLHIPAETLASAPLLPHPPVAPERSMLVPRAAVALPRVLARPVLATGDVAGDRESRVAGAVLFHRAEPPAARPSFEQQRRAMEATEPGRPLSPVQMDRMRENRPVGAAGSPGVRASTPHPAAAQAPPARAQPAAPASADHHH